jgi:hypothetical protein
MKGGDAEITSCGSASRTPFIVGSQAIDPSATAGRQTGNSTRKQRSNTRVGLPRATVKTCAAIARALNSAMNFGCAISYRVEWGHVESKHKRRCRRPRWQGDAAAEFPATLERVRAVEFGFGRNTHNERRDGRQGAYRYTEFVPEIRIEIPHWDFEHPPLEWCECRALPDTQPAMAA